MERPERQLGTAAFPVRGGGLMCRKVAGIDVLPKEPHASMVYPPGGWQLMKTVSYIVAILLIVTASAADIGQTVVVVDLPSGSHSTTTFNCHCNKEECWQTLVQPGPGCSPIQHGTDQLRSDLESKYRDLDIKRSPESVARACAMELCRERASSCKVVFDSTNHGFLAISTGSDSVQQPNSARLTWRSNTAKLDAEADAIGACMEGGLGALRKCRIHAVISRSGVACPTEDPVAQAIELGNRDLLAQFLRAGYIVHHEALHQAVGQGKLATIQLVAEQVDLDRRDSVGQTALWHIDSSRHDIFELLEQQYGAAFDRAIGGLRTGQPRWRSMESMWWLPYPRSLMSSAIYRGSWQDVRTLLDLGASPLGSLASRPFHAVIETLNVEMFNEYVEILKGYGSRGEHVGMVDHLGNSALHMAAGVGNVHAGRWLIDNGAALNMKNDRGRTPLHLAAAGLHLDFVELLLTSGEAPETLSSAVDNDRLQAIHMPLFLGRTPGFETNWGGLTEMYAAAGYDVGAWGKMMEFEETPESIEHEGRLLLDSLERTVAILSEYTRNVAPLTKASAHTLFSHGIGAFAIFRENGTSGMAVEAKVLDLAVSLDLLNDPTGRMRDFVLRNCRGELCLMSSNFLSEWHERGPLGEHDLEDALVAELQRIGVDRWAGGDWPSKDAKGRYSFLMHVEIGRANSGRREYVFDVYEWPYDVVVRERGPHVLSIRTESADDSIEDAYHSVVQEMAGLSGPDSNDSPSRVVLGNECTNVPTEILRCGGVNGAPLGPGEKGREVIMSIAGCEGCVR